MFAQKKVAIEGTHGRVKLLVDATYGMTKRLDYNKVQKVENNEGKESLLQDAKQQLPS